MMATRFLVGCTDCPFTGKYRTRGLADFAYSRHSCERYLRRLAESTQYVERMNAIDRTPKPCLHKVANHQHGTYACYVLDRCRCLPCATANNTYEVQRVRQQAYGRWNGLADAEPARQHVRSLMAQGMGLKRIGAVSGVAHGVLWKLLYGKPKADGSCMPSRRITPRVEQRLLATRLDLADGAVIDSTGAVRRIQALVALGWSQSKIAARVGILRSNFTDLAQGRTGISVAREKAVRELYAEWSMTLPPQEEWRDKIAANRSRNYAAAHGWQPPLAWDDETIDDPSAVPYVTTGEDLVAVDHAAVERRMAGDKAVALTKPERAELVRRMLAQGVTWKDIERRTGINVRRTLQDRRVS